MEQQLLYIIILPLVGFLVNILASRFLRGSLSAFIGILSVLGAFFIALGIFFNNLGRTLDFNYILFNWLSFNGQSIDVAFRLDNLSLFMLLIILGIGSLIHIYSFGYMLHDQGRVRFFAYLNLFIFFMLVLVLADNLLVMFLGWEGVGLCSYLLIGFYYQSDKAASAAKKAFVFNRIGDFGFLVACLIIFNLIGSLNFVDINQDIPAAVLSNQFSLTLVGGLCLLLFLAATGKSAQLPLFSWLPDAMEGPTPVSALIHAATMVTSGIYLIVRLAPIFELSALARDVILYTGLSTALISALIATKQFDVKRILAYSTVSQLGYIFMALGVSAYGAAMFHLMTHAFFKALLFLAAGILIIQLDHIQDARLMGGLKKLMPYTAILFAVGVWSISGMPFGAAFFSKDEILWNLYQKSGIAVWLVANLVSFLTAYYSYRLVYIVFYRKNTPKRSVGDLHKPHKTMTAVVGVLMVCSLLVGFLGLPHYLDIFGLGSLVGNFLKSFTLLPADNAFVDTRLEVLLAGITLLIALGGVWCAKIFFKDVNLNVEKISSPISSYYRLVSGKFFIDELYQDYVKKPLFKIAFLCETYLERVFYFFSILIKRMLIKVGSVVGSSLQNSNIQDYTLAMAVSIALFMIYFLI